MKKEGSESIMMVARIWQENGKRLFHVNRFKKYCSEITLLRNGREALIYFHTSNMRYIMQVIKMRVHWHGLKYHISKKLKKEG